MTGVVRLLLAGAVAGCAALLVLSGAGKLHRSPGVLEENAIQQALRLGHRPWRRVQFATGVVEVLTGAAVLVGFHPVAAGLAMAAQGAGFSAMLAYVRHARIPGACGCVLPSTKQRVTWRDQARAACVLGAGIVAATARPAIAPAWTPSFAVVALVGAAVAMTLVGVDPTARTPVCHRPWWRPVRTVVADLRQHPVFARVAAAADVSGETIGYRGSGCLDEFWFRTATLPSVVVFRVSRPKPARTLAVQASLEAQAPVGLRSIR